MTTKEELLVLIDQLDDVEARRLLVAPLSDDEARALLTELKFKPVTEPGNGRAFSFIGSIRAEPDLSTRYKEIREDEIGR